MAAAGVGGAVTVRRRFSSVVPHLHRTNSSCPKLRGTAVHRLADRWVASCLAMACFVAGPAHAIGEEQQPSSSAWELLRAKYYGERPMGVVDETYMSLEVPGNTPDPAATPLTL